MQLTHSYHFLLTTFLASIVFAYVQEANAEERYVSGFKLSQEKLSNSSLWNPNTDSKLPFKMGDVLEDSKKRVSSVPELKNYKLGRITFGHFHDEKYFRVTYYSNKNSEGSIDVIYTMKGEYASLEDLSAEQVEKYVDEDDGAVGTDLGYDMEDRRYVFVSKCEAGKSYSIVDLLSFKDVKAWGEDELPLSFQKAITIASSHLKKLTKKQDSYQISYIHLQRYNLKHNYWFYVIGWSSSAKAGLFVEIPVMFSGKIPGFVPYVNDKTIVDLENGLDPVVVDQEKKEE